MGGGLIVTVLVLGILFGLMYKVASAEIVDQQPEPAETDLFENEFDTKIS